MFQRDYILRVIQQVAQAVARAMGLLAQRKPEEAEAQLNTGYGALGMDRELLLLLDAATVARQLGDEVKGGAAATLLLCDAEVQHARGDARAGLRRLRAARGLRGQLANADPELDRAIERVAVLLAGKE